jgi:hypothetical protein
MAAASSGSVAMESTAIINGRAAFLASYAFKYRLHTSQAATRYRPSRVANDVIRVRSSLVQ